jgi:hypothetical protein
VRAAAVARLLEWARARGASWNGIEFVVDAGGNVSTVATRALPAGDTILSVPRSLMIVDNELGSGEFYADTSLAAWLARREPGPWAAYVDALPAELTELPMFHGDDDLAMLAGTTAYESVRNGIADIDDVYELLRESVPYADFMWAFAIVQSRGFQAPGTLERRVALIPLVDLLNHRTGDTSWTYDGHMVVTTERAFRRGEEVCFSYGDRRSNSYLFVHYGFTHPDNQTNEAELVIGDTYLRVGSVFDGRFVNALSAAGGGDDESAFAVIADAACRAIANLDAHPAPSGTSSWERNCAIVRAGERAVLEEIIAFAAEVIPFVRGARDVPADASRLLRGYLEAL